ncbi:hypothetical protein PQ455_11580 [Sphingomonas naphthae]|uniref:Antifreeze glycopeptide polyprotein n=1 Tax=Sphingomonas naphthae TaxID=1813468 RepID=A0ABY7THC8_9SPHN|nr:hypothetical protein [Sphingomonas naphthae]WCT72278.1 hypothetical protein PQ455_11580 [Sphingomonas naphthae]
MLAAGIAFVAVPLASVAIGQQQAPESLLPPGFGQPAPAPVPGAPAAPTVAQPSGPVVAPPPPARIDEIGSLIAQLGDEGAPTEDPDADVDLAEREMPEAVRRDVKLVGMTRGYGEDAFGNADGRFLTTLMNRMDAPIASRWMEIALRRALLTRAGTPARVEDADWVAGRANLLLRLGEADAARALVQAVDVQDFTPALRAAAIGAALATSDPEGLCPLSDGAEKVDGRAMWPMVRAMCTSLSGETADASVFPRHNGGLRPIDIQVAEKVVGAGPISRRVIVLDWTLVDSLTDWRFGLASATGVVVPDDVLARSAPRYRAFAARAPMLPLANRLTFARTAAVLGVLSSQDLVDLYGQSLEAQGEFDSESPGGLLRTAYVGDDDAAKLAALRTLWKGDTPEATYAAQILTARAAARIAPASAAAGDIAPLIAAMLAAGLDHQAERFAAVATSATGADGDRAWAMLATGVVRGLVPVTRARVEAFVENAGTDAESGGPHRSRMLVAALAGLERLSGDDLNQVAGAVGLNLARQSGWSAAIDRAAARGEKGTVLLLAAVAMQTSDWRGVPPAEFLHLIRALRRVDLDGEARMIAAEAMARL